MLPTYEEALAVTEASDAFYVQRGKIQGYEYAMFNYRLAMEEDFLKHNALELRGLTFIKDGEDWIRFPMLTKFFNLNQGETVQYNVVKDKEIASIQYKEDGSLISFVTLPNGEIVPKTKMSFDNDQTKYVDVLLMTKELVNGIKKYQNLTFLFELVSPRNKIVLKYPKTELRLLQVRNSISGEYEPVHMVEKFAEELWVKPAKVIDSTLDQLIEMRERVQDMEGWVIRFTDGQFIKLKTTWYLERHGLMDDLNRENKIVKMIMEDTIDDVLGELENGSEEKEFLEEIVNLVEHDFNHRVAQALELREKFFNEYKEDRKSFAIAHNKDRDFGLVMRYINREGLENAIKKAIIQENLHLEKAREYIEKLKEEK